MDCDNCVPHKRHDEIKKMCREELKTYCLNLSRRLGQSLAELERRKAPALMLIASSFDSLTETRQTIQPLLEGIDKTQATESLLRLILPVVSTLSYLLDA
jgi:hypothetical protein